MPHQPSISKTEKSSALPILENLSLKPYNTFGVAQSTRYLANIRSEKEFCALTQVPLWHELPRMVLGGGSNVLFTDDFEGIILKNEVQGIWTVDEDEDYVWVKAGGGENWHELVKFTVSHGLQGIENLALIPGTVGAAPIQNIGAYGVELKDVFESLEALDMETGQLSEFTLPACEFGYRQSIFKKELKGRYFILSVTLRLNKKPTYNTSYGAIKDTLAQKSVKYLSARAIQDAVIEIRQSKLPNPEEIGNCGSFFKNPELDTDTYERLKLLYPDMPGYPQDGGKIKVPAGWLIERCGWKGVKEGNVGTFAKQALVLVNYGNATGKEAWKFAQKVRDSVQEQFGVQLVPEVNVVPGA